MAEMTPKSMEQSGKIFGPLIQDLEEYSGKLKEVQNGLTLVQKGQEDHG